LYPPTFAWRERAGDRVEADRRHATGGERLRQPGVDERREQAQDGLTLAELRGFGLGWLGDPQHGVGLFVERIGRDDRRPRVRIRAIRDRRAGTGT
jgi:hypothetical protein